MAGGGARPPDSENMALDVIPPSLRSAVAAALGLLAALCVVGPTASSGAPVAVDAASSATAHLDWTEYAPLCNSVSNVGVPNCTEQPYPAVFRLHVGTLTAGDGRWSVGVSLRNLTKGTLAFSGRFKLCILTTEATPRTECLAASASARRLTTLAGGAGWGATETGQGTIPAGRWLRVLLPGVTGAFTSPTGGVISWLTVHVYHFIPGGHSVAHYNGVG
jgi:hypothetical protein